MPVLKRDRCVRWGIVALTGLLGACAGDETGRSSGPGITSVGPVGPEGQTSGGDESESESSPEDDGPDGPDDDGGETNPTSASGPSFDIGDGQDDDGETGEPLPGCQAVDFLFVIDNSISMENEQEALVGAFPGFMDAIESQLEVGSDYHIMVLDTDAWGRCDTSNPWDGHSPGHASCNNYVESTVFDPCDELRGAGVLHPAGDLASNELCTPASGKRYIEAGEPALAETFACMATVGTAGHPEERPMNSIEAALDVTNLEVQQCNDGFLRDDALLVVTFVSDDPNTPDEGEPGDWYDAVVAAKQGDPNAVVVLGLGPGGPDCGGGGNHWLEFVEMWGANGVHGPVCSTAEEYVEFFSNAVTTIDQACEDFEPPG